MTSSCYFEFTFEFKQKINVRNKADIDIPRQVCILAIQHVKASTESKHVTQKKAIQNPLCCQLVCRLKSHVQVISATDGFIAIWSINTTDDVVVVRVTEEGQWLACLLPAEFFGRYHYAVFLGRERGPIIHNTNIIMLRMRYLRHFHISSELWQCSHIF